MEDGSGGSKESSQSQEELLHHPTSQQISASLGNSQMVRCSRLVIRGLPGIH